MSLIIPNTIKTRLIFVWTALAWWVSVSVRAWWMCVCVCGSALFYSVVLCSVLWSGVLRLLLEVDINVFVLIYIVLSRIKRIIWIKLNGIKMTNKTCVKLDNLEYWHWQITLTLPLPLSLPLTLTQLHTLSTYVCICIAYASNTLQVFMLFCSFHLFTKRWYRCVLFFPFSIFIFSFRFVIINDVRRNSISISSSSTIWRRRHKVLFFFL